MVQRKRPHKSLLLTPPETYVSLVVEVDGFRTVYSFDQNYFIAERFSRRIFAEMEWFERVVHHQPTVGQFYEILIRNALSEQCPSQWAVSTGFVLDPSGKRESGQLDIIVHDRLQHAPVFESGELVVVEPVSVVSVSEIKKTLTMRGVRETIEKTFFSNLGSGIKPGIQSINIFGFSSSLKMNSLLAKVRDLIDDLIKSTKVRHKETEQVGQIVLENIVLPNIFILDSPIFLQTQLSNVGRGQFKIEVSLQHSHEGIGSLGSYLLYSQRRGRPNGQGTSHEVSSHLGPPITTIKETALTDGVIWLHTSIPMHVIAERFKNDIAHIRDFRVRGKQPDMAFIPKEIELESFTSFTEFVQAVGVNSFQSGVEED